VERRADASAFCDCGAERHGHLRGSASPILPGILGINPQHYRSGCFGCRSKTSRSKPPITSPSNIPKARSIPWSSSRSSLRPPRLCARRRSGHGPGRRAHGLGVIHGGGPGSGQTSARSAAKKTTVEDSLVLTASTLIRQKALRPWARTAGSWSWRSPRWISRGCAAGRPYPVWKALKRVEDQA